MSINVTEVWEDHDKLNQIEQAFRRNPGCAILYFTLIRTLQRFSETFHQMRLPHLVYHGDLSRRDRRLVQEQFIEEPDNLVLATNAFGMGIDKSNIRLIIHVDLPGSLESYFQEIGRAGRDGLPAECLLLYDQTDLATHMEFLRWSNPSADYYVRLHDFLKHDLTNVNAFGIEWLREKLHARDKHDRRLETALRIFASFGVVEGNINQLRIESVNELPAELQDQAALADKYKRDQEKLLKLVQFVRTDSDRTEFLHRYFLESDETSAPE